MKQLFMGNFLFLFICFYYIGSCSIVYIISLFVFGFERGFFIFIFILKFFIFYFNFILIFGWRGFLSAKVNVIFWLIQFLNFIAGQLVIVSSRLFSNRAEADGTFF
jgi:spore maturation protein SpmB